MREDDDGEHVDDALERLAESIGPVGCALEALATLIGSSELETLNGENWALSGGYLDEGDDEDVADRQATVRHAIRHIALSARFMARELAAAADRFEAGAARAVAAADDLEALAAHAEPGRDNELLTAAARLRRRARRFQDLAHALRGHAATFGWAANTFDRVARHFERLGTNRPGLLAPRWRRRRGPRARCATHQPVAERAPPVPAVVAD